MLKQRSFKDDKRFKLYGGNGVSVEGVHLDFWWLQNQTMSVHIKYTKKVFADVHYLVIYVLKPWTKNEWTQVLVLYQDGKARILPVTPEGADWIPFGSSILIGESDPSAKRPHAAISQVDVLVEDMSLKLTYTNGNYCAHANTALLSTLPL
ncbi:hypothetical protein FSP39_021945 [Pinctada imbricata]|uniref:Uncharacterized protein n=1 Tax=Pinctada imbricata TaxID=66713 RepID=A0AA88XTY5_PINIB|nr:hypothetical protein FSP39_021945 [Pinctada imbricata]